MRGKAAMLGFVLAVLLQGAQITPAEQPPKPAPPVAAPRVPANEIQGVVLRPDGQPASKARVGLQVPVQPGELQVPPVIATSDETGAFRFDVKGLKSFTLQAYLAPFSMLTVPRLTGGRRVTLNLVNAARLDGVVLDAATGQPLPNANVESSEWEVSPYIDIDRDFGVARASSDAKGRFTLLGPPLSGRLVVRARLRGYATSIVVSVPPSGLKFRLEPGHDLTGVVRDVAGQPVPKATLLMRPTLRRGSETISAQTNAAGRFELQGLRNVPYDITLTATGFVPHLKDALSPELTTMAVTLERVARVTGRFVDENEKPIRGRARVRSWQGQPIPPEVDRLVTTESAADGTFALSGLKTGTNGIDLQAAGFPRVERKVEVSKGGETVALGDIRFERGLSIKGRIATQDEAPMSGVRVQATRVARTGPAPNDILSAQTDDEGLFELTGLEAESYQLNITAEGFARHSVKATPSDESLAVVLRPVIRIAGRLVDSDGQPVGRARVSAQKGADQTLTSGGISIADGTFTLDLPEIGDFQFAATAEGFIPFSKSLSIAGASELGELVLSRGLRLRGTVLDSKGAAVVAARVENMTTRQFPATFAETDEKGQFEITGLTVGRVRLVATHSQYSPGQAYVELKEGEDQEEARITLGVGGRIEGVVRHRDNSPVAHAVVQIFGGSSSDASRPPAPLSTALTEPNGSFVFDHLYPGSTNVMLMTGQQGSYTNVDQAPATVVDGQTATVSLTLKTSTVRGTLRRKEGSVSGLRVSIVGGFVLQTGNMDRVPSLVGDIPWRSAVADSEGRFALRVAGPLKGRVTVSDGKSTLLSKEVEVPDTDEFPLSLNLVGSRVSGRVLDGDARAIGEAQVLATRVSSSTDAAGSRMWTGRTDASGGFSLELEPGEYRVSVSADGYAGSAPATKTVSTSDLNLGDITLSRGNSLSGRVTLGGLPVAQAQVQAQSAASEFIPSRYAGVDGFFTVNGLPDGSIRLVATDQNGHAGMHATESGSTEPIEIKLSPAARIEVTVLGPRELLGMTDVSISKLDGYAHRAWSRADSTGRSVLFSPAGTVTISATADKLAGEATVQVQAGQTSNVTIELRPQPRRDASMP
jgi:hypothetical protein